MERWMGFPSTFFPTGHPSRQCVPSLSSANADCPILAQKINATVQDRINQEIRRFRIDRWAQEFSIKIQLHQGRRPSGRIPSTDSFDRWAQEFSIKIQSGASSRRIPSTDSDYCLPERGTSSPRLVASGSGTQPDTNTPRRQQEIIVVNLSVGPPHELRQTLAGRQQEVEAGSEPVRSTRGSRELPHRLAATHSPSRFRTKASCVP